MKNTVNEILTENIRQIRKSAGLTQAEMSSLTHFNRSYISTLENGKSNLNIVKMYYLAERLQVPVMFLLQKHSYTELSKYIAKLDYKPKRYTKTQEQKCYTKAMEKNRDLVERISIVRRRQKMTQKELAEKAKMNRTYVSEIENGKKALTINKLFTIKQALQCDIEELIEE